MTDTALAACGGFLLGVLYMDLLFDSRMWSADRGPAGSEETRRAVSAIASYYRGVAVDAGPRSAGVAAVMITLLVGLGLGVRGQGVPDAPSAIAIATAVAPIALALARTFPNARRLACLDVEAADAERLARSIGRDHVFCLASMATFVAITIARG